jgi:hypothetical protein
MAKAKVRRNKAREKRIAMEIIVDAYDLEEQAMGWYYYLEDKLQFPFTAVCNAKRAISPLQAGDEVDILRMASEEEWALSGRTSDYYFQVCHPHENTQLNNESDEMMYVPYSHDTCRYLFTPGVLFMQLRGSVGGNRG